MMRILWIRIRIRNTGLKYYCKIGWSDLLLLSIFKTVHIDAGQVYFKVFNLKKSAYFAAWQSFHIKKSLQMPSFYFKEQKENSKLNKVKKFILRKMGKMVFYLDKGKINRNGFKR